MNLAWFLLPLVVGVVMMLYVLSQTDRFDIDCRHR